MATRNADVDLEAGGLEVQDQQERETALEQPISSNNLVVVTDLSAYEGNSLHEKVDSFITKHSVALISKSHCPFCRDLKDLLTIQLGVQVHCIEINEHPEGGKIQSYVKSKTGKGTVPVVFIRGECIGGCDDTKAVHAKGDLEGKLSGLIHRVRTTGVDKLETFQLVPVERSRAMQPLFWFPNVVNNYVIRVVGFQVCTLSVLSAVFLNDLWGRYLAAFLLVDFCLRFIAGASASPLGMIATAVTSPFRPQFRPGPPKQFAALCGVMFSCLGTVFYFVNFKYHQYVGCAFMAGLAGASGLEWALDFCLGCWFFSIGIYLGLIPDHVYRIYTSTRQETEDSWDYMFLKSGAKKPELINTNPSSPIALKYKKKTDEWTKDDFDVIRHMQVSYFAMPLGFVGLAVAFKIASAWSTSIGTVVGASRRQIVVPNAWYQVFAVIGAALFLPMLALYLIRLLLYTHKCNTEWMCPLRSPGFGIIPINVMLFSFLLYDEIKYIAYSAEHGNEEPPQIIARSLFWVGAITQAVLTIIKMGEWIARRLEMEHIHAQWMIFPVGLSVAGMCAPIVPAFNAQNEPQANGTIYIARFFQSFALFMWIVLFVITFFKVVTTHMSDTRIRHGIFIWLAAPAILGISDFVICNSADILDKQECVASFSNFYFISLFMFLAITWASMPHNAFLGQDKWGMSYWIGCFALDALAAAAALFYTVTAFKAAQTMMLIGLVMAVIANMVNSLHTLAAIVRRRGVFTPEAKWGPVSFMKLTHEAFRGNLDTLKKSLDMLDLGNKSDEMRDHLSMFAAHLNRFAIMHDEHSKHEDQIIFKAFNDWFHDHALKFNNDHDEFHVIMHEVETAANELLNMDLELAARQTALDRLKTMLPDLFATFLDHLQGEEDNLQPIGRKHLPLEIQKQISRDVWNSTSADKWEVVIPFVINNLPRHLQRVRYLKALLWPMPERAHQIGAIVYRNVDAVMWETLRVEVPEMIPRGLPNYRRYY